MYYKDLEVYKKSIDLIGFKKYFKGKDNNLM